MRISPTGLLLLAACSSLPGGGDSSSRKADSAPAAPAARPGPPEAVAVLPAPVDSTVSWQRLTSLVRGSPDLVLAVRQSRDRRVVVQFRDGRRYHATEPARDDIVRLVREVDPSGEILVANE